MDVAGGVQALQSQMEGRTFSADEEGAKARRAVAAKVEELGGWDAVQRDPAALAVVAALMGGDAQVLCTEMEHGFEDVKSSLGRVEVGVKELIGGAELVISVFFTPASRFLNAQFWRGGKMGMARGAVWSRSLS